MDEEIKDILNQNLIENLGIKDLPPEKQEKILLRIGRILFKKIMLKAIEELEEKELDNFEKILKEKNEEKIFEFLEEKIPNFEQIITEEIDHLRQELLSQHSA